MTTIAQAPPPNDSGARGRRLVGGQVPLRERSIRYVKGVGPRRMSLLAQLGIETVEDACYYPPFRYEDRTRLAEIRQLQSGELTTIRGRIVTAALRRIRRGQTLFEAAISDGSGVCQALWFNQPYLAQQLHAGDELILYGRVEGGSRPQLIHPELERVEADDPTTPMGGGMHMGRIVPIYPLASGVGQRWLRGVIVTVLEQEAEALEEPLPEPLRRAKDWPGVAEAIRELHFPSSWDRLAVAQQRLAFDELFLLQLALAQRRAKTVTKAKPQRYQLDGPLLTGLRNRLPFALTASQQRVLEELWADLAAPSPMHRLLQGDVGCGKTILVILLMTAAVQSGYQAALMAPTELLAEQHARVIAGYLGPLGVRVGLLSQGVAAPERRRLIEEIGAGKTSIVVGTHALLQQRVVFDRLALVVIDEQHKFGVVQRAHLAKKAAVPDVLVLTATPIPRTLALSIYGDLAVSTISELPPGRRPITTRWLRESQREELYELIRGELAKGRQGYVVYPLVDEAPASQELKAATQMARRLQAEMFPEYRIGLLHGQMKSQQKEQTMQAFVSGDVQLLVSTVIVEVGLDVPNATVMVIEHPERFGLAQLHQLRGRIGRGPHPATCMVISDATEEPVRQRLNAFAHTTDGFQLAEKDLELRGPGELLGRRQHGWLRFRIANLARDRSLLESAREEELQLIDRDHQLRNASVAVLRERLVRFRQEAT